MSEQDCYDPGGRFNDRKFLASDRHWPGPYCRLESRAHRAKRQWGRIHRAAPLTFTVLSLEDKVLETVHYATLDELLLEWIVD